MFGVMLVLALVFCLPAGPVRAVANPPQERMNPRYLAGWRDVSLSVYKYNIKFRRSLEVRRHGQIVRPRRPADTADLRKWHLRHDPRPIHTIGLRGIGRVTAEPGHAVHDAYSSL